MNGGGGAGGLGYFNKYIEGRNELYREVHRRRDRARESRDRRNAAEAAEKSKFDAILDEIAELKLVVATMLNHMIHKGMLNDEELTKYSEVIDALDGKVDGMFHGTVEPDGTLMPDKPKPRSDLDDLADAVSEAGD